MVAVVTGSGGLVGAESVRMLRARGMDVVGIDNDLRRRFFGADASTRWQTEQLRSLRGYTHVDADIRDEGAIAPGVPAAWPGGFARRPLRRAAVA